MADPVATNGTTPATSPASPPATGIVGGDAALQMSAVSKINREFKEKATAEKAKSLSLTYVNITAVPINPDVLSIVPADRVKLAMAFPFFRIGKKMRVAVADPANPETQKLIEELQAQGYAINVNLATDVGILEALDRTAATVFVAKESPENIVLEKELKAYEQEIQGLTQLKEKMTDMTSEEALNVINVGAIKTGASDIHFQPEEHRVLVRFRIDGLLQTIFELDPKVFLNLGNQLKYKAKMKLNIQNEPQDGRYYFTINQRKIDVRVSALPTEFGETFVCRLLDSGRSFLDIAQLGFRDEHVTALHAVDDIPYGMVLVTGPTGSGKTTTLYSLLATLNNPTRKIITLEDPIEYHLSNISQSQINEKRGYSFAAGLRAVLRQDPDIVMVGEIRDLDTAQTAVQAALTGHIVLSTLHSNSALETIPRLENMGLPPFMIAPSFHMIVAQRLVRKICTACAQEKPLSQTENEVLSKFITTTKLVRPDLNLVLPETVPHAPGCEACSHTGYKGQITIAEIVIFTTEIKDMILNKLPSHTIYEELRKHGFLSIEDDGFLKVLEKKTTVEEVYRVAGILTEA